MNRLIGYQADLLGGPEVEVWSRGAPPSPRVVGEKAAQACAAKAEALDWDREGATAFILGQLKDRDVTSEDLVDAAMAAGFKPHDGRAFGAIFGGLSKAGKIKCIAIIERRKGNGTAGARLWRRT